MTTGSARWSARPQQATTKAPGQAPARTVTGPESMPAPGPSRTSATSAGRVSRRRLEQLARALTDRDRAMLADLDAFGFLTTLQLEALHFYDHRTDAAAARICRRVLTRLSRDRLIERVDRRVGGFGAGSSASIWRLGVIGDRLRRLADDGPRARFKQPSSRFLDHRLAVADAVLRLTEQARSGAFELCVWHTEPTSWRPFAGGYGEPQQLKPDLFVVTASGDFEDHWFIEVDRATESLPTVLRKCEQYERYRRTGQEQAAAGLFPRVVWLVPDKARRDRVRAGIARSSALDERLFVVAVSDQLDQIIKQTEGGADV